MKARKGICAVVFRKRGKKTEFLLLHRVLHWKGWEFPKGGRKENETCEQAFFRELKEELGVSKKQLLKFKKLAFFQEFEDFVRLRHHKNRAFVAELSPKAKILLSKNPDAEHSSFRWVSKEKFLRMIDFQDSKLVFRKALRFY
ncbi:MAG: NUDIX domain-containing protein [Candidatus Diapherotrites archaeon]|nr:NUDIX domain-containing protein [Candidatus Diapherotrites archaeon]